MPSDALKIRTSVPQGVVIAGRPFTLTTTVTNPYDQPIEIISYGYQIPYQVQWIHEDNFNAEFAKRSTFSFLRRLATPSIWNTTAMPPAIPSSTATGSSRASCPPPARRSPPAIPRAIRSRP